jgi:hypothetical protein
LLDTGRRLILAAQFRAEILKFIAAWRKFSLSIYVIHSILS